MIRISTILCRNKDSKFYKPTGSTNVAKEIFYIHIHYKSNIKPYKSNMIPYIRILRKQTYFNDILVKLYVSKIIYSNT